MSSLVFVRGQLLMGAKVFFLCLLLSIAVSDSMADIYSWVDENGVRHFSNASAQFENHKTEVSVEYKKEAITSKPVDPGKGYVRRTKPYGGIVEDRLYREQMEQEDALLKKYRQEKINRLREKEAAIQLKIDEFAQQCHLAKDHLFELEHKGVEDFNLECAHLELNFVGYKESREDCKERLFSA